MRGQRDAWELLLSRLEDAADRCRRGSVATLSYLTPGEKKRLDGELARMGMRDGAYFLGGYEGAERTCLFLLPDYLIAIREGLSDKELPMLLGEELSERVSAVKICGSGYRSLSHRDYLGSVLGLGIERDAIGDIAVQNDSEAVLFTSARLVQFLCENLGKVASDTVRCVPYTVDETFTDGKHYRPISDTVASARLDCVVAALTNRSRENAKNLVQSGLVELEYEVETRTDVTVVPPATLSARGYGRFIVRAFDGETKKGRLRLRADQLI